MAARRWLTLLLLALALASAGCAGLLEFRLPAEFQERKLKPDPPVSALPLRPVEAPC